MPAQVLEVDEDVVDCRVAIRITFRDRQEQFVGYERDRPFGVCEGKLGVADDVRLNRETHRFRRLVRHLGSSVSPAHRFRNEGPSSRQGLSLPYLCARVLGQGPVKVGSDDVVPAGRVPQLPRDRVTTWTRAPRKLLGSQLFRGVQQPLVRQLVKAQEGLAQRARLGSHQALFLRTSLRRVAMSFLTSDLGSGLSIGKCNDPAVLSWPARSSDSSPRTDPL